MKRKLIMSLVVLAGAFVAQAQTADEIIAKYFENTGSLAKWKAVEGVKMTAKVNQGGMEIPLELFFMKDGRQMTKVNFQGKIIKQGVFDGANLWSTNFMNQKAEKSDAEATENMKANLGSDYPFVFMNYKDKGFKIEMMGKESVEGTETFKIKMTKNPIKVDGKSEETVEFYYFDSENFVPLMVESEIKSGQGKGMIAQSKFSDFQEVGGLMIPFSWAQGAKGQPNGPPLVITNVELNPKVEQSEFAFPIEK
jgi:outer membrane lipoprotein-sorting protein